MKRFYVDLHLEIEAEDIDAAYARATEIADQAFERLDEDVLGCWHGEVEECGDEASEEE